MNKYKLSCDVAKKTGKSLQKDVIPIVNALFDTIAEKIISNEKVSISVLGSFFLKDRNRKMWHDPLRNTSFPLPPGKVLKFEPSPTIRRQIRELYEKKVPEVVEP